MSHTCVTHVKNIRRHYGGQPEISVSQNPLAGKHFLDIMVNFCAVFNCGNRASREKEKSYFRFPGIVSNNGEGLTLLKKRRDKRLACISREDLTEYKDCVIQGFVQTILYQVYTRKQPFRDVPNNICS